MKSVNPAQVVNICNNAMQSNVNNDIKVMYAEQKVEIIQSLGLSLKSMKTAQQEVIELQSAVSKNKKSKAPVETKCDECSEVFTSSRNLSNHMRNMHNSGEQKCERCEEVFKDKSSLLSHMQTKTCFWKCKQCCYKSLKNSDVIRHVKRNHKSVIIGIEALAT